MDESGGVQCWVFWGACSDPRSLSLFISSWQNISMTGWLWATRTLMKPRYAIKPERERKYLHNTLNSPVCTCKQPHKMRDLVVACWRCSLTRNWQTRGLFQEEVDPNTSTFWKRTHFTQFLIYNMCSFMLSLKGHRIFFLVWYIQRT